MKLDLCSPTERESEHIRTGAPACRGDSSPTDQWNSLEIPPSSLTRCPNPWGGLREPRATQVSPIFSAKRSGDIQCIYTYIYIYIYTSYTIHISYIQYIMSVYIYIYIMSVYKYIIISYYVCCSRHERFTAAVLRMGSSFRKIPTARSGFKLLDKSSSCSYQFMSFLHIAYLKRSQK